MKKLMTLATALVLATAPALADDLPDWVKNTKIHGLVFGDIYYLAQSHDTEIEGQSGFWIRRVYLGFDTKISDHLTSRLRFEAGHPGDFVTKKKLENVYFKDAWLKYKNGMHTVVIGVQPSLMFDMQEGVWGLRHIEKTPQDLYKFGGSRELGIAYMGAYGEDGMFKFEVQAGNGQDANETNDGKKFAIDFGFMPKNGLIIQLYADNDDKPGANDITTYQLYAAFKKDKFRVGLLGAHQDRDVEGDETVKISMVSGFGVVEAGDKGRIFLRYDKFLDSLPGADGIDYIPYSSDGEISTAILGYEFQASKNFTISPNVEYVSYSSVDGAEKPDNEMMVRITGYWKF